MDGVYGAGSITAGSDYNQANYDDITNFTNGSTLQDDMPD